MGPLWALFAVVVIMLFASCGEVGVGERYLAEKLAAREAEEIALKETESIALQQSERSFLQQAERSYVQQAERSALYEESIYSRKSTLPYIMKQTERANVREFMNTMVKIDPNSNTLRSASWSVHEQDGIIYIVEKKSVWAEFPRAGETPLKNLVESLEDNPEFSACMDIDSKGKVSFSLSGKFKDEVSYTINFSAEEGLIVEAENEAPFGEGEQPVKLTVTRKLPSDESMVRPTMEAGASICYPFEGSHVELSKYGVKFVAQVKELSIQL